MFAREIWGRARFIKMISKPGCREEETKGLMEKPIVVALSTNFKLAD